RRRLGAVVLLGRPAGQPVGTGADAAGGPAGAWRHTRLLCALRRRAFQRALSAYFWIAARSGGSAEERRAAWNGRREGRLGIDERRAAGRREPRLLQPRQGARLFPAFDRAGGNTL